MKIVSLVSLGDNLHGMSVSVFWQKKKQTNKINLSSAEIFTQQVER